MSDLCLDGCRTLLIEMIRRAAYDWVLYRGSTRLRQRRLAKDAHDWLFGMSEDETPSAWDPEDDWQFASFQSICRELDLDPRTVRDHVSQLTLQKVLAGGRPPVRRHLEVDGADLALDPDESYHLNLPRGVNTFPIEAVAEYQDE